VVVSEFVGVDGLRRVKLSDGSELDCDVAVVGIGTAPATAWLAGSGLECHDGVVCNENLETTTAGIYAAGDVARWTNPAYGTPMRTEAWAHAAEQGDVAGFNAVTDGPLRAYSTVPYAWSDWYGHRLQFVGVAPRDCEVHMAVDDVANGRILALCHTNGHLTGALTLGYPHLIMKLRRMIGAKESLRSVLDFVITKLVPANPIPSLEV
jgi:NAD(P)H-nitrite reductase large subunit